MFALNVIGGLQIVLFINVIYDHGIDAYWYEWKESVDFPGYFIVSTDLYYHYQVLYTHNISIIKM